jgi:hypothetical protein
VEIPGYYRVLVSEDVCKRRLVGSSSPLESDIVLCK